MADTPPACPRQPYVLLSVIAGVLSTPTLLTTPRVVGRKRFAQARHTAASAHACPAALEWKMLRSASRTLDVHGPHTRFGLLRSCKTDLLYITVVTEGYCYLLGSF